MITKPLLLGVFSAAIAFGVCNLAYNYHLEKKDLEKLNVLREEQLQNEWYYGYVVGYGDSAEGRPYDYIKRRKEVNRRWDNKERIGDE